MISSTPLIVQPSPLPPSTPKGGGLLCLGSLEEMESEAPWLVFLVSTFPFTQVTQTGRPGLRPNIQAFVCQWNR